jgi:hypothetical protein
VSLGRRWPSGLDPVGPGDRSLKTHPEQILLDACDNVGRVGDCWAKAHAVAHSLTLPWFHADRVFDAMLRRSGTAARMPGFMPWLPRFVRGTAHHPGGRRAQRGTAACRLDVWPWHDAGVRRPGMRSRSRPRARRTARLPGSRGRARCRRHVEARCPMLPPAKKRAGRSPARTTKRSTR